jgi:ABC-2 type transport system permease protein
VLGLTISTGAKSQAEAFQPFRGTVLPSAFLSGYIFLIANKRPFFQGVSRFIPVTYYLRILRGIILRGAGFAELWPNAAILTLMGIATSLIPARLSVQQKA